MSAPAPPAPALAFNVEEPPAVASLHASRQSLADVLAPAYWRALCPWLHVADAAFVGAQEPLELPQGRIADVRGQVDAEGVAQVQPDELRWSVDLAALAAAVVSLLRHGWPPSMLVCYDEVWALVRQASALMAGATGGNACNMDVLAWYVDPARGDAGFSPHRDRQPDDAPSTFRPDGSAMYGTLWLPLTRATPDNSCLYVIPRPADPGYSEGDPEDEAAPDPLAAALPCKEAYQHIRALPADPGSALIFTHRTIHWGSRGRAGCAAPPRISLSWGCADDAYEPAYFGRQHLPCPPLELRVALAGAQMIVYHQRFPAPPKQLKLYWEAFTAQEGQFDPGYREKVAAEFVDAGKEATAGEGAQLQRQQQQQQKKKEEEKEEEPQRQGAAAAATPAPARGARRDGGAGSGSRQPHERAASRGRRVAAAAAPTQQASSAQAEPKSRTGGRRRQGPQQEEGGGDEAQTAAKRPRRRQRAAEQPPPATGTEGSGGGGGEEDEEEDGDGIDWAAVAAAARRHVREDRRKRGRRAEGGESEGAEEQEEDEDSGCDVLDLALDSMLDAELAGRGGFRDDFDDSEGGG